MKFTSGEKKNLCYTEILQQSRLHGISLLIPDKVKSCREKMNSHLFFFFFCLLISYSYCFFSRYFTYNHDEAAGSAMALGFIYSSFISAARKDDSCFQTCRINTFRPFLLLLLSACCRQTANPEELQRLVSLT